MRKRWEVVCWLMWFLFAGALPAYANNPPAPDGMFSLILIFPVVIVGWRWAGVKLTERERKWRIANRVVLTLCVLVSAAGAAGGVLGLVGLLYFLVYGIGRGVEVIQRGQGSKRRVLGGAIMLFTLFALSNYMVSMYHYPRSDEYGAVGGVRTIVTAETTFKSDATLHKNKNGVGEYGTLDQLVRAGLIARDYLSLEGHGNYRFVVVLSGDPARDEKEFFVEATPVKYSSGEWWVWKVLPGGSWVAALHPPPRLARRTFASDESGVIRQADLGGSRPVTRQEAQKWAPLTP